MSDWYPIFFAEVKGIVQAAWPEITNSQFFTSIQAFKQNVILELARGQNAMSGAVVGPYAIIDIGTFVDYEARSIDTRTYQATVGFYYVNAVQSDPVLDMQSQIAGKLNALSQAIETPASLPLTFQWDGRLGLVSSGLDTAFDVESFSVQGGGLRYEPGFIVSII